MSKLRTRGNIVIAALLILFAISYVDLVTGYEPLFVIFYFIPVALCGWMLTRTSTLVLAILSACSWFTVDYLSHHPYHNELLRYWNSITCLLMFSMIGLLIAKLRTMLEQQTTAKENLAKTLAELEASTAKIRGLQGDLQTVCLWTNQIKVAGKWIPLDKFLSDHLNIPVTHGMSPEGARLFREKSS